MSHIVKIFQFLCASKITEYLIPNGHVKHSWEETVHLYSAQLKVFLNKTRCLGFYFKQRHQMRDAINAEKALSALSLLSNILCCIIGTYPKTLLF